ncbi:hypothetical protein J2O09_03830 [Elizabethkingia anophelis]|uniref:hypothetical protein n=1 Tax=Elizabethkingia anophelis TaxID=1117645 RepID=UPI0020B886DB|nr:hypothetical protein [Elizabethkingia anophelis]UTG62099.1 hypothetical protein J2O09_03830 [Elizabethkingia anophelis]UXM68366.1 hypothetical protein N7E57_03830 [Elizabethkingia anophelis]
MKRIRDKIEYYALKADNRWKILPVKRQRLLTKLFFGGYALLTLLVIVSICISTSQRNNEISINHIDGITKNPQTKDTIQTDKINSLIKK